MMKHSWNTGNALVGIFALVMLFGCGETTKTEIVTVKESLPASTYLVEYITGMMPAAEGKTEFTLRIAKRSDGSLVTGLTSTGLSIKPMMYMIKPTGVDSHSTPVDSIVDNGDGTYSCAVYYLMPTMSGYWELKVNIGSEAAVFYPYVNMAMGTDTIKAKLYGADDVVSSMSGTQYNRYYLFSDGPVSAATSTFSLFIAHGEDMNMNFKPAYVGATMSSPTGLVTSMTVTASQDTAFTIPLSAVHSGNGHWTVSGLIGLMSSKTTTIYVKMALNGQDKTIDGMVSSPTSTNYATFFVTPQ